MALIGERREPRACTTTDSVSHQVSKPTFQPEVVGVEGFVGCPSAKSAEVCCLRIEQRHRDGCVKADYIRQLPLPLRQSDICRLLR